MSREPLSRIEKILSNIVGEGSYELDPPMSDAEEILQAILNDSSIDTVARDRICTILLCILNNEEYTGETLSRSEEILKMISQGEKYEVDEWIYEHDFSRVEQLLTDWANKEDPEYIKTVTGTIINVLDAVEKPAESLVVTMEPKQEATPFVEATTNEPYLSKTASTTGNKRYLDKIVGGTVAWNQLVELDTAFWNSTTALSVTVTQDNEFDIISTNNQTIYKSIRYSATLNHVYLISAKLKVGYDGGVIRLGIKVSGSHGNVDDYKEKIATTSTTYESLATIGKTTESFPVIGASGRTNQQTNEHIYIKDFMLVDLTQLFANAPAIADYVYSLEQATAGVGVQWLKDHRFIDDLYRAYNAGELISTRPEGIQYGNTTHAFGSPVELRGLYKLDANNKLYCDGDELTPEGVLKTNYDYRAYQSGDEELTDAITDGTNTVVKKVTPTTASSETYPNPAPISNGDTEAFIDTRSIPLPVGNNSHYAGEYEIEGKTGLTVNHAQTQADTPTTYSVTFTEQGTVYGGTVDIVSGELSITHEMYEFKGSATEEWYKSPTYENMFDLLVVPTHSLRGATRYDPVKVNKYKYTTKSFSNFNDYNITWVKSSNIICVQDPSMGFDVSIFKASLQVTPLQILGELEEPITYQLTPTQVTMLLGENTLWTEDGEITLTYTGTNPAMMMQSLRVQNNILKKQGLTPIEPLKPLDPVRPILKK